MKKLSKLMLAAVATAALAANAAAWDFGVSGSSEATFNQTNTTASDGAKSNNEQNVSSSGSNLKFSSSHTDGDHSASLSYNIDWDGNLDEVIELSGSKKAGDWTGSASVDYNLDDVSGQDGEDRGAITLTNGELTIKMGTAGHFAASGGNGADSTAGGNVGLGINDAGIGAMVDSWQGVSVGMAFSDTASGTFSMQIQQDAKIFGRGAAGPQQANYTTSGAGANVAVDLGGTTISGTYATGSTKENSDTDNSTMGSASLNTLGLNVGLSVGGISPYISYGSFTHDSKPANGSSTETKGSGSAIGATIPMGSDSVVISWSTSDQKVSTGSTESKDSSATGLEVGYNTAIGPATLKFGYGSKSVKAAEGDVDSGSTNGWLDNDANRLDGYKVTDLKVLLSLSF